MMLGGCCAGGEWWLPLVVSCRESRGDACGDSRGDPASTYACGGSCGVLRPLLPAGVEPVSETLRGEAPRTLLLRGMLGGVQAACQASCGCGTPASDVATHGV